MSYVKIFMYVFFKIIKKLMFMDIYLFHIFFNRCIILGRVCELAVTE